MKRKLLLIGFLIVLLGGGVFVFKRSQSEAELLKPLTNKGVAQTFVNDSGESQTFSVNESGYYDINTVSGDNDFLVPGLPLVGFTLLGQYFMKGQEFSFNSNAVVELKPAEFSSVKTSDEQFELLHNGSYFSDIQIPEGEYEVVYQGEFIQEGLKTQKPGPATIDVTSLRVETDKSTVSEFSASSSVTSYEFNAEKLSQTIKIMKNQEIKIKKGRSEDAKFIFTKLP
ncbi:hypothetical protein Hs30E_15990 [Lactococcus hodotermopsidis]|uniref:Uncharacterized protein n=1 Tax=Pseudolactococcus hodotermopsidis TaxID=2709157 RepID=A0A6A0BFC6_9LACT|nr:hypothetical protein [Lactococcus hodotermopsidis]GFH43048.1 hypothetical protein Hs30E_15990 [Lactococcus hodotermopsidis]